MKFAIKALGVLSVLLILSGSAFAGVVAPLTHPVEVLPELEYIGIDLKVVSTKELISSSFDDTLEKISHDLNSSTATTVDAAIVEAIAIVRTVLSLATEGEYNSVQVYILKRAIEFKDKNNLQSAVKILIKKREAFKRGGLTETEYKTYREAIAVKPPDYKSIKKMLDLKADLISSTTAPSTLSGNLGATAGTGAGDGSSTGTGVIGFSIYNQDENFVDVRFSFGESAKITNTDAEFGTFLLNPESARSFTFSYWTSEFSSLPRPYWGMLKRRRLERAGTRGLLTGQEISMGGI